MAVNVAELLRLMLVTDDALVTPDGIEAAARAAVRGGVTCVQLRLKHADPRLLLELTRRLAAAVPVPVLVNDRLDVALAAGARGVHLGPEDLPVALARRIAPPGFLIGASVGSDSEIEGGLGADYWGVGPWRPSATKPGAGAGLGPAGFGRLVAAAGGIPCVAIGGIEPGDVAAVAGAGGAGVAVARGILNGENIQVAAGRYRGERPSR
jgi:thiamine-phosphate pyrophosphorylase